MIEVPEETTGQLDRSVPAVRNLSKSGTEPARSRHPEPFRNAGPVRQAPIARCRMTVGDYDFLPENSEHSPASFPTLAGIPQSGIKLAGLAGTVTDLTNGTP